MLSKSLLHRRTTNGAFQTLDSEIFTFLIAVKHQNVFVPVLATTWKNGDISRPSNTWLILKEVVRVSTLTHGVELTKLLDAKLRPISLVQELKTNDDTGVGLQKVIL